jgi:hypothetical protein
MLPYLIISPAEKRGFFVDVGEPVEPFADIAMRLGLRQVQTDISLILTTLTFKFIYIIFLCI